MSYATRIAGISFHLSDLDQSFPDLVREIEELQHALLNHEEGPPVDARFHEVGKLAIRIFRREEEAMDLCRDRSAALHKTAHQKFLRTLFQYRARFEAEGPRGPRHGGAIGETPRIDRDRDQLAHRLIRRPPHRGRGVAQRSRTAWSCAEWTE